MENSGDEHFIWLLPLANRPGFGTHASICIISGCGQTEESPESMGLSARASLPSVRLRRPRSGEILTWGGAAWQLETRSDEAQGSEQIQKQMHYHTTKHHGPNRFVFVFNIISSFFTVKLIFRKPMIRDFWSSYTRYLMKSDPLRN